MRNAYGTWPSPITAEHIVTETVALSAPMLDEQAIYWIESRPQERGRSVIVCRTPEGTSVDVTPAPFDVRSRVHEYGGGEFTVHRGVVYFTNFDDQRVYRHVLGQQPVPITSGRGLRYADLVVMPGGQRVLAVREDHRIAGAEAVNSLVMLDVDGAGEGTIVVGGSDFYASPALCPDGARVAWLAWNHPNMPWDGSELWVADLEPDGTLLHPRQVAGGPNESILQPQWAPDGVLHFLSDRTGWWNLYRVKDQDVEALCLREAEFGKPPWRSGNSTYAFESANRIICTYSEQGSATLARLHTDTGRLETMPAPHTELEGIRSECGRLVYLGGSPRLHRELVLRSLVSDHVEILRRSASWTVDEAYLSVPEPITFPTENGLTAHALFYPPKNGACHAPAGERPPLLVISHGGPTGAADTILAPAIQFWTSRGLALVDVNYGGSTGYGRAYRERLKGQWGVVDVDDCVSAARYLVRRGDVDEDRVAIRGRSAGGYTTLSALTFRACFKAGASYYGISNLETLATDTHKFESRYLDWLVGPYPECVDRYKARSPINFVDRLSSPMIFFQGMDDKVVPPNQARRMVDAMREQGLPVAYVAFDGEGHGFRMAATIKLALESELYFFGRVFGFAPADELAPVEIVNLETD